MMDYRQAYRLYLANRDKYGGLSPADAVAQIQRSGGMEAAAPAPQGAIATVAPPVSPIVQQARAAVPVAAAPAEVVEEVPVEEDQQEEVIPIGPAQAAYKARMATAPAAAAPNAKLGIAERAKQQSEQDLTYFMKARAAAEEAGVVDPEYKKLIDDKIEQTTTDLVNVDKDRQQAIWMAIAQAGMKMAQSQSPYFMQALASGMEAGLSGYDEAKAKAAEKKARLQETKEGLALKMIEARQKAQAEARDAYVQSLQGAAALRSLTSDAIKGEILAESAPALAKAPDLQNRQTEAQIANIYNTIGVRNATNARAERAARAGGGGGGAGVKLSQLNPIVNGAISENDRLREMLNDPLQGSRMSRAQKDAVNAKIAENDRIIAYGRSLQKQKIGMGSGFKIVD